MIIEGRHAEVGSGIFISDIQPESVAEQAGLTVGDMILCVNKDELLGADYDTVRFLFLCIRFLQDIYQSFFIRPPRC